MFAGVPFAHIVELVPITPDVSAGNKVNCTVLLVAVLHGAGKVLSVATLRTHVVAGIAAVGVKFTPVSPGKVANVVPSIDASHAYVTAAVTPVGGVKPVIVVGIAPAHTSWFEPIVPAPIPGNTAIAILVLVAVVGLAHKALLVMVNVTVWPLVKLLGANVALVAPETGLPPTFH
jgi:hypothetical protein